MSDQLDAATAAYVAARDEMERLAAVEIAATLPEVLRVSAYRDQCDEHSSWHFGDGVYEDGHRFYLGGSNGESHFDALQLISTLEGRLEEAFRDCVEQTESGLTIDLVAFRLVLDGHPKEWADAYTGSAR